MKKLLLAAAAALALGGVASAQTMTMPDGAVRDGVIDLTTPEGVMMANRKVQCSTIDEKPITYYWHGQAYSRRMGERDKKLFDVEGMNIRQCGAVNDAERGMGYKLVSREILLYKDSETGEVLKTWDNPWTGETLEVMHVANDPVNFTSYMNNRDGSPGTFRGDIMGNHFQMNSTFPLWYPNPLASDYQTEIGGTYHATEMFNFLGRVDELTDPTVDTAPIAVGWARMSDWLPWMKMNGREGIIYMHTAGLKLDSFDDLSDTMKAEIAMHYPKYTAPPPVSDSRKNMTSWKYYKAVRDGKEILPER